MHANSNQSRVLLVVSTDEIMPASEFSNTAMLSIATKALNQMLIPVNIDPEPSDNNHKEQQYVDALIRFLRHNLKMAEFDIATAHVTEMQIVLKGRLLKIFMASEINNVANKKT